MKKRYSTKISPGNIKTGRIPAVSLPPVVSCRPDAPCKKQCYAMKSYRMYPNAKTAWDGNLQHYLDSPDDYFADIGRFLNRKRKPIPFFRWHVSGDIPDGYYFSRMVYVAEVFGETRFLAFTKQYDIVNRYLYANKLPDNLTIVFSGWPNFPVNNPHGLPIAYLQDGTETRLTGDELTCPGNCETCGMCWQLPKIGKNVVFNKH